MRDGKYIKLLTSLNTAFKKAEELDFMIEKISDEKHIEIDNELLNECVDDLREIEFKIAHAIDEVDQGVVTER